MKFAICNETFQGWTFESTCDFAAKTGYQGLEIAPFTLAESVTAINFQTRQKLRSCMQDAGLEMVGLHWLLASPKGLYLNHPDQSIRNQTVAYLEHLIHFCADLGGALMVFGSPKQRNVHPELDRTTAWRYAAEGFAALMSEAQACGVTLALEPLAPTETDFINTAAEAVQMIRDVSHPNFRLHLDVKAMCSESLPVDEIIRANSEDMVHFHANDANLRGPGFGDVDYAPIAAALKQVGYQGYVSVEVFNYDPDPETIAVESLAFLKRHFCAGV